MKLVTALGFATALAVGYVAARQLMEHGELVERLPERARPPLEALRGRLLVARQRAATVIAEVRRERDEAEAELLADYHQRVGRPVPGSSSEPGPDGGAPARPREPVWRPSAP